MQTSLVAPARRPKSDPHGIHSVIRPDYPSAVMLEAEGIAARGIVDHVGRRVRSAGLTIDGAESRDLDDAIWADRLSDWYAIWVHISDVSALVGPDSALDAEIRSRTTSVYGRRGVLPMMPHILSNQLLSLQPGSPKLAMTARMEYDLDGRIRRYGFEDTVFESLQRYDHDGVGADYADPDAEHHEMLHLMHEFAMVRRAHRRREWAALGYDESDRQLSLVPGRERVVTPGKSLSHDIVAEFMIAANEAAAIRCYEAEAVTIYRVHEALRERGYYTDRPGPHKGLWLRLYTHFSSPIRRAADIVVHRTLRAIAEGRPAPYSRPDVIRDSHHMNFMREAIEATQRQARLEDRWQAAVERIKAKKETVGFPDLTCYIRAHEALPYSKLPENVAREIIRGLTHGPTGEWAWSIPVLLHSAHPGVKASLYKAVIRRKRLSPRAVLGVLADTRGPTTRQERPWKVAEECSDTHVSVIVTLHGREIARGVASHGPETHEDAEKALYVALGLARAEAVERVFDHFYWAQDHETEEDMVESA